MSMQICFVVNKIALTQFFPCCQESAGNNNKTQGKDVHNLDIPPRSGVREVCVEDRDGYKILFMLSE